METKRKIVKRNLQAPSISKDEIFESVKTDSVIENYLNNSISNLPEQNFQYKPYLQEESQIETERNTYLNPSQQVTQREYFISQQKNLFEINKNNFSIKIGKRDLESTHSSYNNQVSFSYLNISNHKNEKKKQSPIKNSFQTPFLNSFRQQITTQKNLQSSQSQKAIESFAMPSIKQNETPSKRLFQPRSLTQLNILNNLQVKALNNNLSFKSFYLNVPFSQQKREISPSREDFHKKRNQKSEEIPKISVTNQTKSQRSENLGLLVDFISYTFSDFFHLKETIDHQFFQACCLIKENQFQNASKIFRKIQQDCQKYQKFTIGYKKNQDIEDQIFQNFDNRLTNLKMIEYYKTRKNEEILFIQNASVFNYALCLMQMNNYLESNQELKYLIDDKNNQDMSLSADCLLNISINLLMINKEGEFQNISKNSDSALDHLALFIQQDINQSEKNIFQQKVLFTKFIKIINFLEQTYNSIKNQRIQILDQQLKIQSLNFDQREDIKEEIQKIQQQHKIRIILIYELHDLLKKKQLQDQKTFENQEINFEADLETINKLKKDLIESTNLQNTISKEFQIKNRICLSQVFKKDWRFQFNKLIQPEINDKQQSLTFETTFSSQMKQKYTKNVMKKESFYNINFTPQYTSVIATNLTEQSSVVQELGSLKQEQLSVIQLPSCIMQIEKKLEFENSFSDLQQKKSDRKVVIESLELTKESDEKTKSFQEIRQKDLEVESCQNEFLKTKIISQDGLNIKKILSKKSQSSQKKSKEVLWSGLKESTKQQLKDQILSLDKQKKKECHIEKQQFKVSQSQLLKEEEISNKFIQIQHKKLERIEQTHLQIQDFDSYEQFLEFKQRMTDRLKIARAYLNLEKIINGEENVKNNQKLKKEVIEKMYQKSKIKSSFFQIASYELLLLQEFDVPNRRRLLALLKEKLEQQEKIRQLVLINKNIKEEDIESITDLQQIIDDTDKEKKEKAKKTVENLIRYLEMKVVWNNKKKDLLNNEDKLLERLRKMNRWQRAFRKIQLLKLALERERIKQKIKEIESKKLMDALNNTKFRENITYGQKSVQGFISEKNHEKIYEENQTFLARLNYRIHNYEQMMDNQKKEFFNNADQRIKKAVADKNLIFDSQNQNLNEGISSLLDHGNSKTQFDFKQRNGKLRIDQAIQFQQLLLDYQNQMNTIKVQIFSQLDQFLKKFVYFSKFSKKVRQQLMGQASLTIYENNQIIFRQGDSSDDIYFILRGSVSLQVVKSDMGNQPIFIKTIYDGQDFGEQFNLKQNENFTQEVIDQLKQQKATAFANENCYILSFSKQITFEIFEKGLQSDFEQLLEFLKKISIFSDQEMHILLPLANNVIKKKYKLGQYILREGQVPQGLYIIKSGVCKVGTEQVVIKRVKCLPYQRFASQDDQDLKKMRKPFTLKGNFQDQIIRDSQKNRERIPEQSQDIEILKRQNSRILRDEEIKEDDQGNKLVDHKAFKSLMTFFQLSEGDLFGGRVLVTKTAEKGENLQMHEPSLLSVVADSQDVEIILLDKSNIHLYSEDVQKLLNDRLSQVFQADQPYPQKIVFEINNKFRQWNQYKTNVYTQHIYQNYCKRQINI